MTSIIKDVTIGDCRLILGDCLEVMPLLGEFDAVVTDPPYGIGDWVGAITWKTTASFGKFGYTQWTPVLLYGRDIKGFGNVNGITKTDVYNINGGGSVGFQRDKLSKLHVCPKPLNIMVQMVRRYTDDQETILDPFMGSGTTGVACVKLGRKFTGIELDADYFDIACERIREAYKQPDMFVEQPSKPIIPKQEDMF
jgi:DNA modification methylase